MKKQNFNVLHGIMHKNCIIRILLIEVFPRKYNQIQWYLKINFSTQPNDIDFFL